MWRRLCSGFWGRPRLLSCQNTALASFRTLGFLFPPLTSTFSSCNATHSLPILDHCFCFNSPGAWRQSFRKWKFLILTSLHHCLQFLIIGHRYLLMNLTCRTIPIQFWVARTHAFSFCTDFPRCHRMESLTLKGRTLSHLVSNFLNIIIMKSNRDYITIIQYCIMSTRYSKIVVDHEGDRSSS